MLKMATITALNPAAVIGTTTLIGEKIVPSSLLRLGFLNLPTEIRLEIYQHLFKAAKLSCETPHLSGPRCGYSVCSCLFPRQLGETCRQLRYEALPMLLAATTVEVVGSFDRIAIMPASYRDSITHAVVLDTKLFSIRPFQLEKLPALRTLELRNITVWCKFYDEVFLLSDEADSAMYDMALFNLKRTGASLMELCLLERAFNVHLCCQFVVNSLSDETIHAVIDVDDKKIVHKERGLPMKNFHSWSGFY